MKEKKDKIVALDQRRTTLARERTMLSFIRTALSFFILSAVLFKFFEEKTALYLGIISIIAGIVFAIIGLTYYPKKNKR